MKMTGTKRWVPNIRTESQELIEKINWSSSSSSDEFEEDIQMPKDFKTYCPNIEERKKPALDKFIQQENRLSEKKSQGILCENKANSESYEHNLSSTISATSPSSPIIGSFKLRSNSPVLTQHSIFTLNFEHSSPVLSQIYTNRQKSPVLTNIKQLNKLRTRRKCINKSSKIEPSSPDIFLSQASQIIEENDSPESICTKEDEGSNQIKNSIEIIPSQDSSTVVCINTSTSDSSLQTIESGFQYYHQPKPRKKYFKKGGLLHQIQKTISLQTSRVSLWHHDIFCENLIPLQIEHISCLVKFKWRDFGCVLFECSENGSENTEVITDTFLISLGHNLNSAVLSEIGQIIYVFHPYREKLVEFKNKKKKLFYNISKFLTESEMKMEKKIKKNMNN